MDELLSWLVEETDKLVNQHSQLGDDRVRIEGRHEACLIFAQKISELTTQPDASSDAAAPSTAEENSSPTDEEEAAAEALPV
jgi:hypothetical protein